MSPFDLSPTLPLGDSQRRVQMRGSARRLPFRSWAWLDQLRPRLEFAFEVLTLDASYALPLDSRPGALDIRAALVGERDTLRAITAHVTRVGRPRSFTSGEFRLRAFPLVARADGANAPLGVLLVGEPGATDADALDAIDRRLDAAGQWLTTAIEWASDVTDAAREDAGPPSRLDALLAVIEAFSTVERPTDLMALVVEAIAIWYDVDIRAYRGDVNGAYQLAVWLPGVDVARAVRALRPHPLWHHSRVLRIDSATTLEEIGWDSRAVATRFVPVTCCDDGVEWVLTVSGAADEDLDATLDFFRGFLILRLSDIEREAEEALRRRIFDRMVLADAPFHATVELALAAAAEGVGATAAAVDIYYSGASVPALSARFGAPAEASASRADGANVSSHDVTLRTNAGVDVQGVFHFQRQIGAFSLSDVRQARCAVTTMAAWLSGAFGHRDRRASGATSPPVDFVARARLEIERAVRENLGGALLVIGVHTVDPPAPALDTVADLVQQELRESDIVGVITDAPNTIGALVLDAPPSTLSAVAGRVARAVSSHDVDASIDVVPLADAAASVEAIVRRARTRVDPESGLL